VQRQFKLTLFIWLLALCLLPIQAFGHTKLVEISPKPDSQLVTSPDQVQLLFSQKLEAANEDSLVVKDDAGKLISAGTAEIGADGKRIYKTLPTLPKGTYRVHYHVMSMDGHMVEGEYAFTVLAEQEEDQNAGIAKPQAPPVIPEEREELEAPIAVTPADGATEVETGQLIRDKWTSVFSNVEGVDGLRMVYYIVFLLLIGMVIWYVVLRRGRSEEDSARHRNWILQLQRIHLLLVIALIVEFVQHTAGFDDWSNVLHILLNTTTGISWAVLLLLSLLGLAVLHRNRYIDIVWVLAFVMMKTQIGHPAASDYRMVVSLLTAIHILAAAIWAGGLLYLILLWRRYRHVAEKLILKFSNASLVAIVLLSISGILSSVMYLTDLSYIFETRWGFLLLLKVAFVLIVIGLGSFIRRRFIRKGLLQVGAWIKLDFMLLVVIASLAALLTAAEPNPPNEPLHWHVMGNDIHMTAEITPRAPGNNRFTVSVWLPMDSGEPKDVSMEITLESEGEKKEVVIKKVNGSNDDSFVGFNKFMYQVEDSLLDQAGNWLIDITVTDQRHKSWSYTRKIRVY